MKTLALILTLSLVPLSETFAAYQSFPVRSRIAVVRMDALGEVRSTHHLTRCNPALFRVEILSDSEGAKPESSKNGKPFITAQRDERFAVRLYNPLPVRVAVNLTVDGVNSISGKPSGISDGEKWVIGPYGVITIRGWQVSEGQARRFFFTDKPKSYATWTGDRVGKDLSVNCGVIGAAYFWSQKELDRYNEDHPEILYTERRVNRAATIGALSSNVNDAARKELQAERAAAPEREQKAGTGMGESESNPTTLVDFSYDTGMYQLSQAVVIYYDFAAPAPVPNPFPAISFAPEMPENE